MIINDKRALAYVQEIHDIKPIVGADNIELVHVNAWELIAKKGEFKEGDKCVYFEIDSKLDPDNPAFEFMSQKKFAVKPYKLNKFGVVSMGLALPLDELGISKDTPLDTDLTDKLKITYYIKEDNVRKADDGRKDRFANYMKEHQKFYNSRFVKKLMKHKWFRELQLKLHGGKKVDQYKFPTQYVSKTDEERIQNCPQMLQIKKPFIVTEKIDGTSTTILVERCKFKRFKTYVCSRNVCFSGNKKAKVYNNNDNIYLEMNEKYHISYYLTRYLIIHPELKWVCIQGESYGKDWQGNPLKLDDHRFAAFNFKDSKNGRWGSIEARDLLAKMGIPWVPIVDYNYILPDTVNELIDAATGSSAINESVLREGWVLRSPDGQISFKAVSTEYLLKK